jgi:hypothetical protein
MKTKQVTRHYCDFCSKGSFKKPTMAAHEAKCFLNPARKCGMCEETHGATAYGEWVILLRDQAEDRQIGEGAVAWLRKVVDDCPACMLAVIQQAKVIAFDVFDYRKERDAWRGEMIREEIRADAMVDLLS